MSTALEILWFWLMFILGDFIFVVWVARNCGVIVACVFSFGPFLSDVHP